MPILSVIAEGFRVNFRNYKELKCDGKILTFKTTVTCLGNSSDNGDRCLKQLSESAYAGLENCIQNPVMIRYSKCRDEYEITLVTVDMNFFKYFEVI